MKFKYLVFSAIIGFSFSSCNNSSEKEKTTTGDSTGTESLKEAPVAFNKEVSYGDYKFTVSTHAGEDRHHFKLIPQGLTEFNDTLHEDVRGNIADVIIDDIDGDNFPEVAVIDFLGSEKMGHVHVFSTYGGKSMGAVHLPELASDDPALKGYKGGDEFAFVENSFIRRFPVYEGDTKTAVMRQLQYKLEKGEASKHLAIDKVVEF